MPPRRPPTTTGKPRFDALIDGLLDEIAPVDDRDLFARSWSRGCAWPRWTSTAWT